MITHKQITINGQQLSYYDAGAPHKHVAVLVHGVGASSRYMLPLDFPGFGHSNQLSAPRSLADYAKIHHDFINQLRLKPFVLIGNSFGCQIIVEQLVKHQADARAVVLIGPTINNRERSLLVQMWRYTQDVLLEPKPGVSRTIIKDYLQAGPRSTYKSLKTSLNDRIEQKISRVSQPILILRGSNDAIVPLEWTHKLASLAPSAKVVQIEGGAHALNMNQPDKTAYEITNFLQNI